MSEDPSKMYKFLDACNLCGPPPAYAAGKKTGPQKKNKHLDFPPPQSDEVEVDISPDVDVSEPEESITIKALMEKFLRLQDKVTKMGKDIQDLENRLYRSH